MIHQFCEAETQWCVTRRQRETTARKWGWKSSQSRAWTAMLEAPLWTAPWCQPLTPPTTGCAGRPLPLRTSCLVLAGRSPGLEEPPLYNRFPSRSLLFLSVLSFPLCFSTSLTHQLFFLLVLSVFVITSPSLAHFSNVSSFLLFISLLYVLPPPFPSNLLSRCPIISSLFSLSHFWPLSFAPYPHLHCVSCSQPPLRL